MLLLICQSTDALLTFYYPCCHSFTDSRPYRIAHSFLPPHDLLMTLGESTAPLFTCNDVTKELPPDPVCGLGYFDDNSKAVFISELFLDFACLMSLTLATDYLSRASEGW